MSSNLVAVLMERGHVPREIPRELRATRDLLRSSGRRFIAAVVAPDTSLGLSVVTDDVEAALVPCVALQHHLGRESNWLAWVSDATRLELANRFPAAPGLSDGP